MAVTTIHYQSYLLRLSSTGVNGEIRATLLSVNTPGEEHHFATLDDLSLFLNTSSQQRQAGDTNKQDLGEATDAEDPTCHRGEHMIFEKTSLG